MKATIKTLIAIAALGGAFIGGVFWEYAAEQQSIAEIQQVAQESCQVQLKLARMACK